MLSRNSGMAWKKLLILQSRFVMALKFFIDAGKLSQNLFSCRDKNFSASFSIKLGRVATSELVFMTIQNSQVFCPK